MGALSGTLSLPYVGLELGPDVAVQVLVERLDLFQSRSTSASKAAGVMS